MKILENLNERLTIDSGDICPGGEKKIDEIRSLSPVKLPEDYIDFLKNTSGQEDGGIVFSVDGSGNVIYMGC